jgi:hypothetical protein
MLLVLSNAASSSMTSRSRTCNAACCSCDHIWCVFVLLPLPLLLPLLLLPVLLQVPWPDVAGSLLQMDPKAFASADDVTAVQGCLPSEDEIPILRVSAGDRRRPPGGGGAPATGGVSVVTGTLCGFRVTCFRPPPHPPSSCTRCTSHHEDYGLSQVPHVCWWHDLGHLVRP